MVCLWGLWSVEVTVTRIKGIATSERDDVLESVDFGIRELQLYRYRNRQTCTVSVTIRITSTSSNSSCGVLLRFTVMSKVRAARRRRAFRLYTVAVRPLRDIALVSLSPLNLLQTF